MFKRTEFCENTNLNALLGAKERKEAPLQWLQALKSRISKFRAQCEELQRLHCEDRRSAYLCYECGLAIEPGDEIESSYFSDEPHLYHKECFRRLWLQ